MSLLDNIDRYMLQRMHALSRGEWDEPIVTADGSGPKKMAVLSCRGMVPARLNLLERASEYVVNVDLPGINKEDIQVHVENGYLSIMAERKEEKKDEKDHYHYSESQYGSIRRVISLPEHADPDQVKADLANGVLSLTFAKKPEVTTRKQILVQ